MSTLGSIRDELPALLRRSGTGSGAITQALADQFLARARRRIQRADWWTWQQTETANDLASGDTSFPEPSDVRQYRQLWVRNTTTAAYISPLEEIGRDQFVRLTTSTDESAVESLELTTSLSAAAGAPRVYSRWSGSFHLFPVVSTSDLTVVLDYYRYLVPDLAAQASSYTDALLVLHDLCLYGAAYEAAIYFREPDIATWRDEFARRLAEEMSADRMLRDRPEGEYANDQLRG